MFKEEQYGFRNKLTQKLHEELIGPTNSESVETIETAPLTRYLIGMLYPISGDTPTPEDNTAAESIGESEEIGVVEDTPVAMANLRYPSSAGITFAVDTNACQKISVSISAAVYRELDEGSETPESRWQRVPLSMIPLTIDVTAPQKGKKEPLSDGLQLYYRVRLSGTKTIAAVTLVLMNSNTGKGTKRDADAFFQVGLVARAADGASVFVERPRTAEVSGDEDLDSYKLLYRKAVSFGVGHGCSVNWTVDPSDPNRAIELRTDFAPQCDLLLTDSNETAWGALDMEMLSSGPKVDVLESLRRMSSDYLAWVRMQQSRVGPELPSDLHQTARDHLVACSEAAARMNEGIATLESNPLAWDAFRLANQAMLDQRRRTIWLKSQNRSSAPGHEKAYWRPFQLAFLLLCLRGIVDPSAVTEAGAKERELVDLIWFPTGGGKTEAYLGLVAFVLFHRRLRDGKTGAGVTVLMRYTLRLLTIQQFERAALLIACCERLRQLRKDLGDEMYIGLWVGQGSTPNNLQDAKEALVILNRGGEVPKMNPQQLDTCIWCGTPLTVRQYRIEERPRRRLVVTCSNSSCDFKHGLPVYLVDEDIYNHKPAMIIATADKFAALPWNETVSSLFNLQTANRPPELIIQDELHLISGPLGTLAGLYETAVDELCSYRAPNGTVVRPKIVASTATIRRSRSQNKALFARDSRQFPPPGLDASDSFFAEERSREKKASRLYLGLMAPASSHSTLMIRVYACLLQSLGEAAYDKTLPAEALDPYWTLVGYFNSLRVLGGARMQVQDDVDGYMKVIAGRNGTRQRELADEPIELTSRRPSSEMKPSLKMMSTRCDDPRCPDVVIATNMISVGVDIDRLGLMVIMGQPQGTSEYIQASSRVGRQHPGLVVTLFNSARTRDRSHYESFLTYHSSLYRRVESSSLTPFSTRARDRGLHAVIVSLLRHTVAQLASNPDAQRIEQHNAEIAAVKEIILSRIESVSPEERTATSKHVDDIIAMWKRLALQTGLTYQARKNSNYLLVQAAPGQQDSDLHIPTLNSLRDVDSTSDLYLER